MNKTGVLQIDWPIKKLSELFEITSSKRVFQSEWTTSGVPFYRAREIVKLDKYGFVDNELFISETMYEEYKEKYGVPSPGDILITAVGTIGICYEVKEGDKFYFKDGNSIWLKNRGQLFPPFFKYVFNTSFVQRQVHKNAAGATVATYTIIRANETHIPLPPLPIQKKIVQVLDKAQELIDFREQQLKLLDELVQSVFYDMFGDPVTNPKGWEVVKIGGIAVKTQYGTSKKAHESEGEFPILRMNNITYEGKLDLGNLKYINLDKSEQKKFLVKEGEVLFNRTNSKELVGKTTVYNQPIPMAFAGYLIKIIPKDTVIGLFISIYLNTKYCKLTLLNMAKNIIGMANINAEELKKINIYLPPISLQNEFAEKVQKIEEQKALMKESLQQMKDNYNSLMQRAFRGELFHE